MNVERRRRQLLALINDPATFEGERENARRALERLGAPAPPLEDVHRAAALDLSKQVANVFGFDVELVVNWGDGRPASTKFDESLRSFRAAAEAASQETRRWRAEVAAEEAERRFREGRS